MIKSSVAQCTKCKYSKIYKDETGKIIRKCEAFPNGIPTAILLGEIIHDKLIKGQNGEVIFEAKAKYIEQDKQLAINQHKLQELFENPSRLAKIKEVLSREIYRMVRRRWQLDYDWSKSTIKITRLGRLRFSYDSIKVFHEGGIIEIKDEFKQLIPQIDVRLSQLFTLAKDNDSILEIIVFSDGKYLYSFSSYR